MKPTPTHRAATVRRPQADSIQAIDVFAGFGGMSSALEAAGVAVIHAANHNAYAIDVHERNHPYAEHLIADFVDSTRPDYMSAAQLPYADWAHMSPSCTNHSGSNAKRAYHEGIPPHTLIDPDYDEQATVSERSRATMSCVLQYAAKHHPKVITIENVSEVRCWGRKVEGKSYGDGTTFTWWRKQLGLLGYHHELVDLNAQFFGVPQSRDRLFIVAWQTTLRRPNLNHQPLAWCHHCQTIIQANKTTPRIPPSGRVRYGTSYHYTCPECDHRVHPPTTPALKALDLTNLGPTLRERPHLPKQSTMDRITRAKARMAEYPAILMPTKALRGTERHPWQPMNTQTTQAETTLLSSGAILVAAGNTYEHPGSHCRTRGLDEPLWAQTTTNTTATLLAPVVIPYRNHTNPTPAELPMPTQTTQQVAGLLTAALVKQNGGPESTAPTPFGTITTVPTETLLTAQLELNQLLGNTDTLDMHWRMLTVPEVRRGMGVNDNFESWGPKRNQIAGYGNMVCPPQGQWIAQRVAAIL